MKLNDTPPVLKVLVVEDNPLDFELMQSALSSHFDCDVKLAATKEEFETEIENNQPNFIVSDSNSHPFDGLAALRLANERCPDVPFIFCSGADPESAERVNLKDTPCVTKEANFSSLVAYIKKHWC